MWDGYYPIILGIVLTIAFCVLFPFLTMFLLADYGVTLGPAILLTIVILLLISRRG